MSLESEDETERARRHRQRRLFDAVARLYAATRPGYPPELAQFVAATAGARAGAPVLEVGCGTGQLTSALLPFGFALTAIDIGTSMIEVARERAAAGVTFRVASFEDLDAAPASFDLVISGAAFHWIDPGVRFRQAARLLRPGGWLALAGYEERYDEPVGSMLDAMWLARSADDGVWVTRRADARAIGDSKLFGPSVHRVFRQRLVRSAADVIGVENTRATSLSWPGDVREAFFAELRARLGSRAEVSVTLEASVTMAPVASPDRPACGDGAPGDAAADRDGGPFRA
ncbi:MAG TPA: class I SAM-dependent methyltransferase [Trebonia sp.]